MARGAGASRRVALGRETCAAIPAPRTPGHGQTRRAGQGASSNRRQARMGA